MESAGRIVEMRELEKALCLFALRRRTNAPARGPVDPPRFSACFLGTTLFGTCRQKAIIALLPPSLPPSCRHV